MRATGLIGGLRLALEFGADCKPGDAGDEKLSKALPTKRKTLTNERLPAEFDVNCPYSRFWAR